MPATVKALITLIYPLVIIATAPARNLNTSCLTTIGKMIPVVATTASLFEVLSMPIPNAKPSDFTAFAATVYQASATVMDFDMYFDYYEEVLKVLFWNPHVDTPMAIAQQEQQHKNIGGSHV
ncbi:hypothetical protein [Candidatus Methylobacter oryzae]|uniref:Uncharacterized protein n=1 Tax=Candidatus Methylobacter oryzae TaxID=2497749 RepID=A0ABY3CCL5_9GAMM|nr:hypothetical protein [Candidatus Methylobacter oryzae]TRW99829.1 hypothetical protein EKO24_006515 [Candidatus Methylobacter oryzae]